MFLSWQGKKSFVKCAWTEFIMDLSLGSVFRKHSNNFCLRSWRSSIFVGRALTSVHMPHTCHGFSPFTRVASLTLWNLFERCILHNPPPPPPQPPAPSLCSNSIQDTVAVLHRFRSPHEGFYSSSILPFSARPVRIANTPTKVNVSPPQKAL